MRTILASIQLAILACALTGCGGGDDEVSQQRLRALPAFNRGGALVEQYEYARAVQAYEEAVRLAPQWTAARFNLGLAYFNMLGQEEGQPQLESAREAFEAVLASEPDHIPARFGLGHYYQHVGDNAKALELFHAVHERDPHDPHAAYKYAEVLLALGRDAEATEVLEQIVAADGGFISAVYRLALQYQRSNRREDAAELFDRFAELNSAELTGGSFVVQKAYDTVGKYYRVLGVDDLPLPADTTAARPLRLSPEVERLEARSGGRGRESGRGLAVGDVDNDGDLDLCLATSGADSTTALWLNDGAGNFTMGQELSRGGVSPCFGDVDNDGDLDLWLGRDGGDEVYVNDGSGALAAAYPGLAGADDVTRCARLVDLDSDGDLDFLAFRGESSSVFNSNGDDTHTDAAVALGLGLRDTVVSTVVYDDFDNDRDLDLIVFAAGAASVAWRNERVGAYRLQAAESVGVSVRDVLGATTGDPDKDGDRDLLVFARDATVLYRNDGAFGFTADEGFTERHGGIGASGGQFADMDNDGDLDIVIADARRGAGARGPMVLINDSPRTRFVDAAALDRRILLEAVATAGAASCAVADFTGDGRCDILLAPADGEPLLIANATPGGHWIEIDLRGTRERDRKARSNASGIGARVEVRTGAVHQQFFVGGSTGAMSVAPARVHAGLGDNTKVDWLRIVWPDAVLQAELDVAADTVVVVEELQRKTSSCPYLFAWSGEKFEFVADFGGVGGLGYLVAPGLYAPPDPTEYLRVPRLEARDGDFVLQCLTALEEVTYFDEAKLIAVDHPEGTEVYPHEMMAVGVPPPPPEVFCVERPIHAVRAVDERGADVTETVLRIDRSCAGASSVADKFLGLAEDHFVELDFGDRLAGVSPARRLVLFLYGWVEYGYSSTNYAASQAGQTARAPSIHVLRGGEWVEVLHEVGYPAGVEHMMALEVSGKILPGDRRIRISTNMELYWDQIFLAEHLDAAARSSREVAVRSADLHFRGYPAERSPDGHHPLLPNYDEVVTDTGWKTMPGNYTRFGEVGELLQEADDRFVIMEHGTELTLRFAADAFGPVPAGQRRTFILKTDSFCKDMDLYTGLPDAVEPLPFHAMSGYPYGPGESYPDNARTREYLDRYNTRRVQTR